jgi:hypothetical protein
MWLLNARRRVARFLVVQYTKTGKIYQMTTKIPKCHTIYRMAGKWTKGHKIYQHLPLHPPPKSTQIGNFGLKYTIWQPNK